MQQLQDNSKILLQIILNRMRHKFEHNQLHCNIKIKTDTTKVKQCRRDFRKGNYKEIRKRLAHIDWNDKMKNKTASECWIILRSQLVSAIDRYVPMKYQGKRSKKKSTTRGV